MRLLCLQSRSQALPTIRRESLGMRLLFSQSRSQALSTKRKKTLGMRLLCSDSRGPEFTYTAEDEYSIGPGAPKLLSCVKGQVH